MKDYTENGITVIEVPENIQKDQAELLEEKLFNIYNDKKKNIIIDLREINHICSSALGSIVSYKRLLKKEDGDIKLIVSSDELKQLFSITMLNKIFEMYDSKEEAILSFPESN
ncbi:MAG: STAS domain-containing protein [Spirochaetia bacterium]|nr:STAS domain-containing protein [Spirochaetia bacterium]